MRVVLVVLLVCVEISWFGVACAEDNATLTEAELIRDTGEGLVYAIYGLLAPLLFAIGFKTGNGGLSDG